MNRTPIELYIPLELPPVAVRDAVTHVMRGIGEHDAKYDNLSLAVALHIPGRGHVSVPIETSVSNRPQRWECGIRVAAAKSDKFFPTFNGTISVTPDGGNHAELWLQGDYVPPGGALGRGLDATLLRGVAKKSLREFLSWLAGEVKDEVNRTQRERADQARRYHG